MATVRHEFSECVLEEYAKRGLLAEVVEVEAWRSLVILATPDIGEHKVPLSFYRPDWVVELTLWHGKWWARFLRRVDRRLRRFGHRFPRLDGVLCRLGLGLQLPDWLDSLVHSEGIRVGLKKESLPVEALERIAAMANYLQHHQGVQPMQVLVGRKAMLDLRQSYCADYWPAMVAHFENPFGAQILGLTLQISPFLAPDEILVV